MANDSVMQDHASDNGDIQILEQYEVYHQDISDDDRDSDEIYADEIHATPLEESGIITIHYSICIYSQHSMPSPDDGTYCNQCSKLDKQKASLEGTIIENTIILFPPAQNTVPLYNPPIQLMDPPAHDD